MLTNSAGGAGHSVHINRAAAREHVASLDRFELIREQAHEALNAIRSRCREDHSRILNRLCIRDAVAPPYPNKPSAEAATPLLQPRLRDFGRDADGRMKISRPLAEARADAANEMAWSSECGGQFLDKEQPRIGQEVRSIAVAADGEFIAATVNEAQQDASALPVTSRQFAALSDSGANELNESADVKEPSTTSVDLEVEEPPTARVDFIKDQLLIEFGADESSVYSDGPRKETRTFAGRRHLGRGRPWLPKRWPMSRPQTAILILLVLDCILVGWRGEVVRALPQTSAFYKLVGLSVNFRGLDFDGVATTTEQDEGVPILVVEGNIVNSARRVANVPQLKFIVRNATGQEIYSWIAEPSRPLLSPGEMASFRTQLTSPPPDAHDVLIRFVDQRDIVAAVR